MLIMYRGRLCSKASSSKSPAVLYQNSALNHSQSDNSMLNIKTVVTWEHLCTEANTSWLLSNQQKPKKIQQPNYCNPNIRQELPACIFLKISLVLFKRCFKWQVKVKQAYGWKLDTLVPLECLYSKGYGWKMAVPIYQIYWVAYIHQTWQVLAFHSFQFSRVRMVKNLQNEYNKRYRAFCPPLVRATRSKLTSDKTSVLWGNVSFLMWEVSNRMMKENRWSSVAVKML